MRKSVTQAEAAQTSSITLLVLLAQQTKASGKISEALEDESWVELCKMNCLQFEIQKVWILVDLLMIDEEVYVSQLQGSKILSSSDSSTKNMVKALYGYISSQSLSVIVLRFKSLQDLYLTAVKESLMVLKGNIKLGFGTRNLHLTRNLTQKWIMLEQILTGNPQQEVSISWRRLIYMQCKNKQIVATSTNSSRICSLFARCVGKAPLHKRMPMRRNSYKCLRIHHNDKCSDLLTKAFDVKRFQFLVVSIGMMVKIPCVKHFERHKEMYEDSCSPSNRVLSSIKWLFGLMLSGTFEKIPEIVIMVRWLRDEVSNAKDGVTDVIKVMLPEDKEEGSEEDFILYRLQRSIQFKEPHSSRLMNGGGMGMEGTSRTRPLWVVMAFNSPFGLAMVLLGRDPVPEVEAVFI
ncbi:hypothetical protein Tco_0793160 [Tanacetum coccineum]